MNKFISVSIEIGNIRFSVLPTALIAHQPNNVIQGHSHANFEFHVVLKGKTNMDIEDQTVALHLNDSVLIFPDTFHRYSHVGDNTSILSFRFNIKKIEQSSAKDYYSKLQEYISHGNEHTLQLQNPLIVEHLKNIHTCFNIASTFSEERIKALLILLFSEMLLPIFRESSFSHPVYNETSEYDSRINIIERYFNKHFSEDISLSKLSELLFLSQKQTDHIIRKTFGIGFRERLSKVRLKNAKNLLRSTEMEVQDIATAVGYQSYNGFYLAFKSKFGITPLEYRDQKQKAMQTEKQSD